MYCSLRLFFASTGSGKKKWFDERELHWPAIKHFLLKKKKKSIFLLTYKSKYKKASDISRQRKLILQGPLLPNFCNTL